MAKHPDYHDIDQNKESGFKDNLTPTFKYDTRGRLIMPLPGYTSWRLQTEPGSKIISQGTSTEDDKPGTDPGSLRTGALNVETIIEIGDSIKLDASNKQISVGDKPGELGGAFIMADHSLTGWQDTSLRFGWFLDAQTKDSKTFDKGDFYVGNIVINKSLGTITSGKGMWWDNANGKLYIGGDVVIGGSVAWSAVVDDGHKPDDDATLGATWGVNVASQPADSVIYNSYLANGTYAGGSFISNTTIYSPVIAGLSGYFRDQVEVGGSGIGSKIRSYGKVAYADSSVGFYLEKTAAGKIYFELYQDSTHYFRFASGAGATMEIRGAINADDITAGTLQGVTVQSSSGSDKIVLNTGDYIDFYAGSVLKARLRATTGGAGGLKLTDGDMAISNPHSYLMEETTSNQFAAIGCNSSSQLVISLPSTNQFFIKNYAGTSNYLTVSSTQTYIGGLLNLKTYSANPTNPAAGTIWHFMSGGINRFRGSPDGAPGYWIGNFDQSAI